MKPTLRTLLIGLIGLLAPSAQAATLTWNGATSGNWSAANWTGGTPVNSGTDALNFAGTTNLSNTNDLTSYTASSITFVSGAGAFTLGGNAITLAGNVTNNDGDLQTISLNLALTSGVKTFATTNGHITVSGTISGDGGIRKTGTSLTLFLTGTNNSYTGVTEINGGPLSVTKLANGGTNSSIGASSNAAANLLLPNGTSALTYAGTGDSTDRLFTAGSSTGFIRANGSGALNFTNTGAIAYSTVDQARGFTLGGTNTGDNTFAPLLGDNGTGVFNLTKADNGKWILTNANTFSGITLMSRGILQLNNGLALQNSTLDATNSRTGDANHGISLTSPTALTLGGLTGSKDLSTLFTTSNGYSNLTALTLNPGTGKSDVYTGGISNGAAGMTLTKTGLGTQTLSGTNTYTGATTVTLGTLIIDGTNTASAVTVQNLATIGGSGSIGTLAVQSGGILSPGNSSIANLTLVSLTLNGGAVSNFDIGATFDTITTTAGVGSISLAGTLNLIFSMALANNTPIDLFLGTALNTNNFSFVTLTGGGYTAGGFSNVGTLWTSTQGSQTLSFEASTGVLSAVPEPGTWALLAFSLTTALVFRRRRRD